MKNRNDLFIEGVLSLGYVGYLPKAGAAVASVLGMIVFYLVLMSWGYSAMLVILLLTFLSGLVLMRNYPPAQGLQDPKFIVFDEFAAAGILITYELNIWVLLIAFLFFRAFDNLKPFPISVIEKRFSGGLGIMVDDVIAAAMAMIICSFLAYLLV